ncbi:MAG: UDP-N-acetylmuramoyl-tripeptide--D-alanyl-D-alanine ligase [Oscillospiraceae bacterium]|nr:UDP-N-acetylmuramoyl-tripeptide--D-alanyl-D-alanine ligase [Oscillospiraceae bacterium]
METLTLKEIAQKLGVVSPVDAEITEISTDTRNLPKGCLFLALRGKKFDGHYFVRQAITAGAVAAVTDTQIEDLPCLVVENTGKALLDIANLYRKKFDIPVVAVTGSVGKTTTKELIACVLSEKFNTLRTEANLNNEIGMPKTILNLTAQHGAAVLEMGMNHFGEISHMTNSAEPTIAVITNIGFSHVENLGSQEGIKKAKLEILEGMKADAPLVTNADDKLLSGLKTELNRPVYTFSTQGNPADVSAEDIKEENGVTTFTICYQGEKALAVLPAVGEHNVKNALAAYLVGRLAGMEEQEILCGIARYQPTGMRQNIMEKNGQTIIADCYNASPDSMQAGLNVLSKYLCDGRKIAVLGDMLELGNMSSELHSKVGVMVKNAGIDMLFCYGKEAEQIAASAGDEIKKFCTENPDILTEELRKTVQEGDVILFKASHGMHLENIITALYGEE